MWPSSDHRLLRLAAMRNATIILGLAPMMFIGRAMPLWRDAEAMRPTLAVSEAALRKPWADRARVLGPHDLDGCADLDCLPGDEEVLAPYRRAHPASGGEFVVWRREFKDVRIEKDKIADYIDPTRIYPLIGPAQTSSCAFQVRALVHRGDSLRMAVSSHEFDENQRKSDLHRSRSFPFTELLNGSYRNAAAVWNAGGHASACRRRSKA